MLQPKTNEKRVDFINRCMLDKGLIEKYPDSDVRYGYSLNLWEIGVKSRAKKNMLDNKTIVRK